ncbi:tetraspanin-36-like [Brevipalpus obovatus]|uniref:tetraspanin-36-like n=1 Tax=Brevipalpus obovatus TaxID=246614 RepID=UPI003D9E24C9
MMGKTGYTCLRRSLCLLNFFFWVAGAIVLAFGLWLTISLDSYSRVLSPYHILSAGNLMIAVGLITFCISLCGLCGSWFQNKYLLGAFLTMMILIMVLEVSAASFGYIGREKIRVTLRDELLLGIREKYDVNNTNGLVTFWDAIQENLDCCGVDSLRDWYNIKAWPSEKRVPQSCCKPSSIHSTNAFCKEGDIRENGCYPKLKVFLMENLHYVAIAGVVFAFIQFFTVVASLLMICTVDYKKQYKPVPNPRPTYNRVPTL